MTYRGYKIVREKWSGETIIWIEFPEGPVDAPSMRVARAYIDNTIEENESLRTGVPIDATNGS